MRSGIVTDDASVGLEDRLRGAPAATEVLAGFRARSKPNNLPRSGPLSAIHRRTVLRVFYTPGWGAVLTVTGTLGGVVVTQGANMMSTRGAQRKERNDHINDAVSELIGCGNAWVYAVDAYGETMINAGLYHTGLDEQFEAIDSGRGAVRAAVLSYRRAVARVMVACPRSIIDTVDDYGDALQAFEDAVIANAADISEARDVDAVKRTLPEKILPEGVVAPQDRVVEATRRATGRSTRRHRLAK